MPRDGVQTTLLGRVNGNVEDSIIVYESDQGLDKFNELVDKMRKIEPRWMEYIKAVPVVNVPTNIGVDDESLQF
jgi:hypothetical protein